MRRASDTPVVARIVVTAAPVPRWVRGRHRQKRVLPAHNVMGRRVPYVVPAALALGLAMIAAAVGGAGPGRVRAGSTSPYVGIWKAEVSNVTTTTAVRGDKKAATPAAAVRDHSFTHGVAVAL